MRSYNKYWLVDSNELNRIPRVNTSTWNVVEIINDRFFVVSGVDALYIVHRAGYTGVGIEGLGGTDLEAVQRLNSMFVVENTWHWLAA